MSYKEYIQNILESRGRFGIASGVYKERHHIIPKCLGGTNHEDNLIDLYPEEHFIAHKLLYLENKENIKLASAWLMMAFPRSKLLSREYPITKEEYRILREEAAARIGRANKGLKWTEEQKSKLKNRTPWNKGLTKDTSIKVKQYGERLSKILLSNGTYKGENNPQFGNSGRITGDKNPMKLDYVRKKFSNNMKINNPMKDPEVSKRVHEKTRGRKWYHDPLDSTKRGQFFEGQQPLEWIPGMGKLCNA